MTNYDRQLADYLHAKRQEQQQRPERQERDQQYRSLRIVPNSTMNRIGDSFRRNSR